MEKVKPIGLDGEGYELLTEAVRSLLNEYPELLSGDVIRFEQMEKESGIAFSADNGALIISETVDVIDHVVRTCQYPFYVIYRTKSDIERQKINAISFLDKLGKWICKEAVVVDDLLYKIENYPELTEGRNIKKITRMNSYGLEPDEDGVQDWLLPCIVHYTHEFNL